MSSRLEPTVEIWHGREEPDATSMEREYGPIVAERLCSRDTQRNMRYLFVANLDVKEGTQNKGQIDLCVFKVPDDGRQRLGIFCAELKYLKEREGIGPHKVLIPSVSGQWRLRNSSDPDDQGVFVFRANPYEQVRKHREVLSTFLASSGLAASADPDKPAFDKFMKLTQGGALVGPDDNCSSPSTIVPGSWFSVFTRIDDFVGKLFELHTEPITGWGMEQLKTVLSKPPFDCRPWGDENGSLRRRLENTKQQSREPRLLPFVSRLQLTLRAGHCYVLGRPSYGDDQVVDVDAEQELAYDKRGGLLVNHAWIHQDTTNGDWSVCTPNLPEVVLGWTEVNHCRLAAGSSRLLHEGDRLNFAGSQFAVAFHPVLKAGRSGTAYDLKSPFTIGLPYNDRRWSKSDNDEWSNPQDRPCRVDLDLRSEIPLELWFGPRFPPGCFGKLEQSKHGLWTYTHVAGHDSFSRVENQAEEAERAVLQAGESRELADKDMLYFSMGEHSPPTFVFWECGAGELKAAFSGKSYPLRNPLVLGVPPDTSTETRVDVDLSLEREECLVSRRHAQLVEAEGVWWLSDLGSKNGTRVGDTRLEKDERRRLDDGDLIVLADQVAYAFLV